MFPVQSDGNRPRQRDEQRPANSSDAEEHHQHTQHRLGQNNDGAKGNLL